MSTKRDVDLFICAVGYESRSTAIWSRGHLDATRRVCFGFLEQKEHAFSKNLDFFAKHRFEYVEVDDRQFSIEISSLFARAASLVNPDEDLRIGVDISCFNRSRLASIVDAARRQRDIAQPIRLEIYYTLAQYSSPSTKRPANVHAGPVSAAFAGWTQDPSLPPAGIVGLGYEQDKALGALEHLQVPQVIALMPRSEIGEYDETLRFANSSLLTQLPHERLLRYRVEDPAAIYSIVESVVQGLKGDFNPILLPFGPKIFFLACVLAACHHPEAAVWRVSAGSSEESLDRLPSAHAVSFSTRFCDPLVAH
jgi:hypothetical protein